MMHFVAAEASGGGKVNIHTNMLGAAQPGAQLILQCLQTTKPAGLIIA